MRVSALAKPAFFTECGQHETLFFARMPVGEHLEHQVAFDAAQERYYCSCPFFPKPCLHAHALAALSANAADNQFLWYDSLPDWVEALQQGRSVSSNVRARAQARTASRERRRFERLERAEEGLSDLEKWLHDTFRRGLSNVLAEEPKHIENIAVRMADASLSGLSRSLRLLSDSAGKSPDWMDYALQRCGEYHLLVKAFRKRDQLPEPLLYDIQQYLGIQIKKEDVLRDGESLRDYWAVTGSVETVLEDRLLTRRTWLLGAACGRYALFVEFAFGGAGFAPGFGVGSIHQGAFTFYPSAWPQRALPGEDLRPAPKKVEKLPGYETLESMLADYATALTAQPWLNRFPAALTNMTVFARRNQFFISDNAGKYLPLACEERTGWELLARFGGQPCTLFGEWENSRFSPLSVLDAGGLISLDAN